MSVKVNGLTKIYGQQKAIDNLTFELEEGEIMGLLGPNGAGKSTTMKILTCFIPQTSGSASVCGYDVETHATEVKRNIGYLPEHNPLYTEMYIKEYLAYVAGFYKVANPQKRISELIDLTGLGIEQRKKIGMLSKGYRQRVGLAQALMHDPKVLILDEPTTGLDPNQLAEIRKLIKEIGKTKTIILSTHIMQEVEAMCKRVAIIDRGVLVANDLTSNLQNKAKDEVMVSVEFDRPVGIELIQRIPGVKKAQKTETNTFTVTSGAQIDLRKVLFDFAVANNLTVLSLNKKENSLEQVFRSLTSNNQR